MENSHADNPVVLCSFEHYTDAIVLESMLKSADIHAAILEQNQGMIPHGVAAQSFGGVRVVVAQKDADDALSILRSMEAAKHPCPHCGSTHSEPIDNTPKTRNILAALLGALGLWMHAGKKKRRCSSCAREFDESYL